MSYTNILGATFATQYAADYHEYVMLRVYRRDWLRTGDWQGPYNLHPTGGEDSLKSRGHSDGAFLDLPALPKGYGKIEARGNIPLKAGVYMPDINLHKGFDNVCRIARDTLKRELVKSERKPLFAAYVKACNKYQLVCLPDQTVKPLVVCGGTVWEETAGCITRFSLLVEKAMGRQLTRKEGVFIKAQWPAITAAKRSRIRDQSHTNTIKDNQTIYTTEGKKINQKIHSLLDAVHGYSGAVSKLRKMLSAGAIDHEFYNDRLAELRKNRDKALEILKEEGYIDTRLAYGSGRVMHNSKGVAPEKPANMSKRYALDDYRIDEETGEYGKARIIPEDTRTPTIWKDGTRKN